VSTKYGEMVTPNVLGPMSGLTTTVARRPLPLEAIPAPSAIYWPSQPTGMAAAPSQSPTPPAPAASAPTDGGCCG
jgi:hypothetical protein